MTFREFLSDRMGKIILEILVMTLTSVILFATGTQSGVITLLIILICLIRITSLLASFFICRSHLNELERIMSGLDRKYLFTECTPPPKTLYERKLFALMRRSCKSMTESVSDAESAMQDYREYVESWVHEIKSPITAAKLICHDMTPETRRRLSQELARIEAHVERALFYARMENPERDCIIRECNLEEIVSKTIETYRTLLMQSNIRIETDNLNHQIYTDEKWTCFILGQLMQNAARYQNEFCSNERSSFKHSSFAGSASHTQMNTENLYTINDTSVIFISAERTGKDWLILDVSDNGIGIPSHELPRVFDRGFTGSNGRVKGGSTGMGLYLCRKLADFLDIDIQIISAENEGTCVTLTFPVRDLSIENQ